MNRPKHIAAARQRLRNWLLVFFVALAIPAGILLMYAYSQMKWEALHQYRLLAEDFTRQVDRNLGTLLQRETQRSYADYSFVTTPVDNRTFTSPSPLSAFPVATDFPGLIGYFQVDSQGVFQTPLLPGNASHLQHYGITAAEGKERQALANTILGILSENHLVRQETTGQQPTGMDPMKSAIPNDQLPVTAPAARRADSAYPVAERELQKKDTLSSLDEDSSMAAGQAMFDQLSEAKSTRQKSKKQSIPGTLGRVEDLQLEEDLSRRASPMANSAERAMADSESRERVAASPSFAAPPAVRITTFENEIDPFEFSLLDSGHFVLFRKVWRDGQRYIQGMILDQQALLQGSIDTLFRDSSLFGMSELIVAYQGDVFSVFHGGNYLEASYGSENMGGTLLYRSRLSSPMNGLELLFKITHLPSPGGAVLVHWLALIFGLILCAGSYLIYRLGVRQIELTQQQQDFVAAVSHELKTPLTSIRMYAEMLGEGWAPEEKKLSYYRFIQDESERLSRLINNVLQLARMNRNEPDLQCSEVSVSQVMDQIESRISSQLERAGFSLVLELDDTAGNCRILVDVDGLIQILINLVDNAIKFSQHGEKSVVELRCTLNDRNDIQFSVRDFGPGISQDQRKKIFQLFYRSGNELTRETVGTGIGLALVQQLATAMNAKIDVANCYPGAEFRISFPVVSKETHQHSQ